MSDDCKDQWPKDEFSNLSKGEVEFPGFERDVHYAENRENGMWVCRGTCQPHLRWSKLKDDGFFWRHLQDCHLPGARERMRSAVSDAVLELAGHDEDVRKLLTRDDIELQFRFSPKDLEPQK